MGIKLAIDHPEKLKHLVVIGSQPTHAISIQALPLDGLRNIAEYYQGDGPSMDKMRAVVRSLAYDHSSLTDAFIKERYEASITPNQLARGRDQRRGQDLYFELERNRVPTLVVWGLDDKGGALEVGLLMTRRFQNARMYIFPRCGHWAQLEHRAAFDRLVLDYFKND
jgi:pimeloyl-ACP methyl ester carboxylesterase